MRSRRVLAIGLVAAALFLIGFATLQPTPFSYRAQTVRLGLDLSANHLREDLLNALLFAPLGFASALIGSSALRTLCVAVGISVIIEILQWTVVVGRFAEVQDVMANALGAMLGWYLAYRAQRLRRH